MGLVERWNNFARKEIYINHTFSLSTGRLVFTGMIAFMQMGLILLLGGNLPAAMVPLSSILFSLKPPAGWTGKILGVTDPDVILGVNAANIQAVIGVE